MSSIRCTTKIHRKETFRLSNTTSPGTNKSTRNAEALAVDEKQVPVSNVRAVAGKAEALTKELEAIHPHAESPVRKRCTRISSRNLLNEFLLFPKLPIELRLTVWSMVELAPVVVAQRKNSVECQLL
ncbi:hypothetical protein BDZ45DRAFT_745486 [Acephala macrosclerotiorum]|nr:hypothetical protein BDZ45DRAFT_745486 [Acephala macrosclerotiorum]